MRKERNLERKTDYKEQNKRRKINENEYQEVKESWGRPENKGNGEKRNAEEEKKMNQKTRN